MSGIIVRVGEKSFKNILRGPFLESPGNLPGLISVFGDKCFLTEVTDFRYL